MEELKRLLEKISEVMWDAAAEMAWECRQLRSAQEEVLVLESLLAFREMRWEIAAWSDELRSELG